MLINIIKLTGLLLMLGGLQFYIFTWYPLFRNNSQGLNQKFHRRIASVMPVAGGLFLLGSLVQLLETYRQYTQADPAVEITGFLFGSVHGLVLFNLVLVPVIIITFRRLAEQPAHKQQRVPILAGLLVLFIHAVGSHAASDGLLAGLSNVIHLLSAVVWAGGLCYFALIPWPAIAADIEVYKRDFWKLDERFFSLVLLMFILVAVSGSVLALVHVHSMAALHGTQYGTALKLKLVMAALLLLMLAIHLLKTGRMLKRMAGLEDAVAARSMLTKYRRLIRAEAVIVIGLIAGSAAMRSFDPPDIAPFLNPQTLSVSAEGQPVRIDVQPVAGNLNSVRMEIFLPAALAGGDATQVYFSLDMPGHDIRIVEQEALRASADSYQGEATFPVPGEWQLDIKIVAANSVLQTSTGFTVQQQPLVEDISTYLSLHSIVYNSSNMISFGTGLLMVIIYGWLVRQARRGEVPQWIMLAGPGGILFGLYLSLSVALVKTYPSTYQGNPLPLTASVVSRGQQAYTNTCAECHGTTGKGDGPWTIANRGAIPDLGSPHLDVHTDGELFWWITHGIPELEMPARDKELNEDQRWELINYIRSLRHAVTEG